jgi:hypothetical protein
MELKNILSAMTPNSMLVIRKKQGQFKEIIVKIKKRKILIKFIKKLWRIPFFNFKTLQTIYLFNDCDLAKEIIKLIMQKDNYCEQFDFEVKIKGKLVFRNLVNDMELKRKDFEFNDNFSFWKDEKKVEIKDLKVGDKVKVCGPFEPYPFIGFGEVKEVDISQNKAIISLKYISQK